jgi:hypothetical protein
VKPLPCAASLTAPQYNGWACVWCATTLDKGAVSAGRATGQMGAHAFDIEVYACPGCATAPNAERSQ